MRYLQCGFVQYMQPVLETIKQHLRILMLK